MTFDFHPRRDWRRTENFVVQ